MARRKEVFQSKVLQKFYPPPKPEKERDPPQTTETLARKTHAVKRKTSGEDALHEREPSTSSRCRRVYTVLPPPPDYDIQSQESVTLPQLHGINSAEDPAAEKKVQELSEDSDEETEEEEEEQKRRRRRKKKRKAAPHLDSGRDGEALGSQTPAEEGGERLSRNKKRKLKKKRHKEKLLAMGLVPRAAAVEFTYQRDAEEDEKKEEEKDDERKAAEVSDFLRTTTEIYMSDSSSHPVRVPRLSATVDELLDRLAGGTRPVCVLRLLDQLKAFAQRGEAGRLEKALEEFRGGSLLSAVADDPAEREPACSDLFTSSRRCFRSPDVLAPARSVCCGELAA